MYNKQILLSLITLVNCSFTMYFNQNENQILNNIINRNIYEKQKIESIYPINSIPSNIIFNKRNYNQCRSNDDCNDGQNCDEGSCINNIYENQSKAKNFLLGKSGLLIMGIFVIFLIIVFVVVLKITNKHNKIEKMKYTREIKSVSNIEYQDPDILKPSDDCNLYIQTENENVHNSVNQIDNDDYDDYKKNEIENKTNDDPYTTYDNKKDYDIENTSFPKTPQSAQSSSTLINKSYGSTNNLIEKRRFSMRNSISMRNSVPYFNFSYRKNSVGALSSPIEASHNNNFTYHDFNTSSSCFLLNHSDNRYFVPQFNTYNSPIPSPNSFNQSLSLHQKSSIYESQVLQSSIHEGQTSTYQYPLEMDIDQDSDGDDHTTLSFDEGVLKVSLSDPFNNKNKSSAVYSYSEIIDSSSECIIPSPKPSPSRLGLGFQ